MLRFAARSLTRERVRLLISVGGVAFAVMLVLLLRGLFVAYQTRVSDFYERIDADLWVVQSGTADFFHSFSLVDHELADVVADVDGVESVRPYLSREVAFPLGDQTVLTNLVGFDPDDPVGGPGKVVSGTAQIEDDGIVVDRVFARQHGLDVGDVLDVNGNELRVRGISTGGDLVMFQYSYTTTETARRVLGLEADDSALLVDLEAGADQAAVAARIEDVSPVLSARSTERVIEDNQAPITESFLPVIRVLLVIGFVVGVAVIGLTIYSAVLEKRHEYGVLKAVGVRARQMVAAVSTQALLTAAAGFGIGVALAILAGRAAERWVPEFITELTPPDVGWMAIMTVGMAVVASLIPLARIARIDPAEVFRR